MTTTDYLLNALFVFLVLRQAHERKLDLRSMLTPLLVVFLVGNSYLGTIPTTGNDVLLIGGLAAVGVTIGILSGMATHVRREGATLYSRIGPLAGSLLIGGFLARMAFVLAAENGAGSAIRSFSITNHISAAAWPVALVAMALLQILVRLAVVQLRARRLPGGGRGTLAVPAGAAA